MRYGLLRGETNPHEDEGRLYQDCEESGMSITWKDRMREIYSELRASVKDSMLHWRQDLDEAGVDLSREDEKRREPHDSA